ncbi:RNA polymerase sigma factor [Anaeromyxobacter oryzae]|uniref:RNA polymerase sigma24 factor n=1 Tax=Anaeromyxobacter oryzae TaxID=2918170 RepID=A0ABN6MVQ6_9BACT|nr:DUF6596 domain-containing protein [Anaeromyxobacter oryzae]BDG05021.1 RNA polymerase sigma24 factor [Anaeromyxobacter oryzae]
MHEALLKELGPQVLAVLLRRERDFTLAEDAVQEALIAAAVQWKAQGIPENPRAWVLQVAQRRLADHLRSDGARRRREEQVFALRPLVGEAAPARDDTLELLFLCCHPALTAASAIALTARAVGGLTTQEIARAFLVPEATMGQRISRAKETIQRSGTPLAASADRLSEVMHVLYLMFNEGYTASAGPELQRPDLALEAIRLTRMLEAVSPEEPEVAGLLSLMLLTDARRAARTGPSGELIPLDEQDRSRWDRALISQGVRLLTAALSKGRVGVYQLQASIAAAHVEASRAEDTDWTRILGLYGLLRRIDGNPMVALNHAVAVAMVHGAEAGLKEVDALPELAGHHRTAAVRAHLLERAGQRDAAAKYFRKAAALTDSAAERDYLLLRAARLGRPTNGRA